MSALPSSDPHCYRLARGFSFRREPFGGILYHYAGVRPDPDLYFVRSPFLMDLLEVLRDHPHVPLAQLVAGVCERFSLSARQQRAIDEFFGTLTRKGALISQ